MDKNIKILIAELEDFKNKLYKNLKKDDELFINVMQEFREFILTNSSEKGEYYFLIEDLKKNEKYIELKKFFYEAECYWEYLEEVKEKENFEKTLKNVLNLDGQLINKTIKNKFGIETMDNAIKEANWIKLEQYNNIIMVGCGSFPYTLINFAYKYPNIQFIGIDKNIKSIENALELKKFLKIKNIKFKLCDGNNYDYNSEDLVIIADLASDKSNILDQIYRTNEKTKVIIRNPILYGILTCDEFEIEKEERYKLVDKFLPNESELYINLLIEKK